jgi:hypothetical protein
MKQGLEGRLRRLEQEYAAELESQIEYTVGWLTTDDTKQGRLPGLYEIPPEDGVAQPREVSRMPGPPCAPLLVPVDQPQSVSLAENGPSGESRPDADAGAGGMGEASSHCLDGERKPEVGPLAGLDTPEGPGDDPNDWEVLASEDPAQLFDEESKSSNKQFRLPNDAPHEVLTTGHCITFGTYWNTGVVGRGDKNP